jgi:flagellar basal-body rod protein FlgG
MPATESGRPGALFYTVQNENGELRYSRNGNFTIDGAGFLTSSTGQYILNTNVVYAEDPMLLVKEGDGLLRFEGDGDLPTAVGNNEVTYQLQQGFIERSNVDASQTMTEMMNAYRSFEANQRILQAYDQSMEKAVNEIGRIG